MAMTITQVVTFACATTPEYSATLSRLQEMAAQQPDVCESVAGDESTREITVETKPVPFEFAE